MNIPVSRKVVQLDDGTTIRVDCNLLPDCHPNYFATRSRACDLASRLGIGITGIDTYGKFVGARLRSPREF